MNIEKDELTIPEAALRDEEAVELVRVWVAGGGIHISLKHEMWHDPSAWGIALAEVIRRLAEVYGESQGLEPADTMLRVSRLLQTELVD